MAGHEREADDVLEVAARFTIHGGEVTAADASQQGGDLEPARTSDGRCVDGGESHRTDPSTLARSECCSHPGGGEAKRSSLDDQRLHRRTVRASEVGGVSSRPMGPRRELPPSARSQCSTSQPRRRAMEARRASGLTATGKPTASSMARSDAESA